MDFGTGLLARFHHYQQEYPEKNVFTFVNDKGQETESLTYKELAQKVSTLAQRIKTDSSYGIQGGDCVLLVYPPSLGFIIAFLACLVAQVIAVPVYPPDPRKLKKDIEMFSAVATSCKPKVALTCSNYNHLKKAMEIKEKFASSSAKWPELKWIATDKLLKSSNALSEDKIDIKEPEDPNEIAFLQFTSGSTSLPKGVMISYQNLSHNLQIITKGLQASENTIVVSWLPQYHDMGLIGAYLGIIYNGGSGYYMSPFSFIKSPGLWIQLISKYRATHVQAPNFAFKLCARKVDNRFEDSNKLDLSCLQHIINAAEPVEGDAIDAFISTFRPLGLKPDAIVPTYGLAEHTVFVCEGGKQRLFVNKQVLEEQDLVELVERTASMSNVKEMIGCGFPSRSPDVDLRIVDPDTLKELSEDKVGEIWIDSPSKALGYYGLSEVSAEAFNAKLVGQESSSYLRTGDLGFLHNQELFICGRLKDLIIIRGRNHFPQDLEKSVETFHFVRPGCTAAFSISQHRGSNSEMLAVAVELREDKCDFASCAKQIQQLIASEHGVSLGCIAFLKARTIPKTTSGKIARHRCAKSFVSHSFEAELYRMESSTSKPQMVDDGSVDQPHEEPSQTHLPPLSQETILPRLKQEISVLIGISENEVELHVPLQQLGLDSMALTQLRGIIQNQFKIDVDEECIYNEETTVETLRRKICQLDNEGDQHRSPSAEPLITSNSIGDSTTNYRAQTDIQDSTSRNSRVCCGCIRF